MTASFTQLVVDNRAPGVERWAHRLGRAVGAASVSITAADDDAMPTALAREVEQSHAGLVVIARRDPTGPPWLSLDGVVHQIIERSRVPVAIVPASWAAMDATPSRVGVGVDGSARSMAAVRWCAGFASVIDAAVWVVHAADVGPALAAAGATGVGYDAALTSRRALLDGEWTAPLRAASVRYETVVQDGGPVGVLFDTVARHALELLVVGARGADDDPTARLGSIAHRVAGLAPCPCVIVPPGFVEP